MSNIIALHIDLVNKTYVHRGYHAFNISDPKPRNIHKASVRDRLLHYAIYRILYFFFDQTFIADSYSCRMRKGTHKALKRFKTFSYKVSKNHTKTVWILKCDIRKFFASIDQNILLEILAKYIPDKDILWLLEKIVRSFETKPGRGLPLGNLTSQLLVNIYMNEFDQFIKHKLKEKYYIRYSDDFVFFSEDKRRLEMTLPYIQEFLWSRLRLELHPDKVFIKTLASGVDFLGWVHFPNHRVLRTATKKKMFRRLKESEGKEEVAQSYLGLLSHGNTKKLQQRVFAILTS
jgi:retron-type reverse transcriptase